MADVPPQGSDALPTTTKAFQVVASIDVDEQIARLTNETRRLISDYSQQGLTGEALATAVADGLDALSDVPLQQAGRGAVSEAFNLGRNLAIQEKPNITTVVRTEILDENTCPPCHALDGQIFTVNSSEYFENMPPNKCDGREFCRGFYLARL
jgi:hypothetical protein